jgi:hypothetical protein
MLAVVKVDKSSRLMGGGHTSEGISCRVLHAVATERNGDSLVLCCVVLVCVCSLGNAKPVDSSHFMGGIIRWRPVDPAVSDGRVRTKLI